MKEKMLTTVEHDKWISLMRQNLSEWEMLSREKRLIRF
jgi:hypothetical protein